MLSSFYLPKMIVVFIPLIMFLIALGVNIKSKKPFRGYFFISFFFLAYIVSGFTGLYFFDQIEWPTIQLKFGDSATMLLSNGEMIHPEYIPHYLIAYMAFFLLPGIVPCLGIIYFRKKIIKKFDL